MKIQKPLNSFRLIGQLSDKSGRRFRREMVIATSESFDELSERAERLLVGSRDNVELDSFMLIPAPSNDRATGTTDTESPPSRWARAISAAAEAMGLKEGTEPKTIVKQTKIEELSHFAPTTPIPPAYSRPPVTPVIEDLKAEDGIVAIEDKLIVVSLNATPEETEICFESKT